MSTAIDRGKLQDMLARSPQLVEVLPAQEYEEDHIPGARSIPLSKVDASSAKTLDPRRPVVVYCWDAA